MNNSQYVVVTTNTEGDIHQGVHQVVYLKTENGQLLVESLQGLDYEYISKSKYRRLKKKFKE